MTGHMDKKKRGQPGRFAQLVRRVSTEQNNLIKFIVIAIDLAVVASSYVMAYLIRFSGDLPEYNTTPFISTLPFVLLSFFIYLDLFGLLTFYRKTRRQIIASIIKLVIMQALTTTSIAYFMRGFSFPRSVLLYAAAIQLLLLTVWNWLMLLLRDGITKTTVAMVIGEPENIEVVTGTLADLLAKNKIEIKYIFTSDEKETYIKVIRNSRVDEVILCTELSEDLKMEILLLCMSHRKIVYIVPEVFEIALMNAKVLHLDDTPLLVLDRMSLSFEQRLFKRIFDLAATVASLPLLLPFLLAVALGVKLSSPGKAIFSQERVTSGGRIYKIYKFRTMFNDAERLTGPVLSNENDERVTPFGKFLRRYRIDEFPQLINVLKGDMSLVGPRSERPYFVERFSRNIEGYTIRNNVKAGLTGYAQIFGHYDTDAEMKLKYDILYIKNYSLLLDVKLIFQTFNTILKKGGS